MQAQCTHACKPFVSSTPSHCPFMPIIVLSDTMEAIYKGQRVSHFESGRSGEVITWYLPPDWRAGKMWIKFDDEEVELRWASAFPPEGGKDGEQSKKRKECE